MNPMSDPETISCAAWLHELEVQLANVLDVGSASAVHQMRVAAGRLSVWLELGDRTALRDDLRWLRRTAMQVRDTDVMLATGHADDWRTTLLEKRRTALATARRELATSRPRGILMGLAFVPDPDRQAAQSCLQRLARRALRAGESLSKHENDPAKFHRLRRRVRRTRYALEWIGHDSTHVEELQGVLGRLNDQSVELEHLELLPDAALRTREFEALEAGRARLRAEASAGFEACRTELRRLAWEDDA